MHGITVSANTCTVAVDISDQELSALPIPPAQATPGQQVTAKFKGTTTQTQI